jgi:putative flavoprotein involved in K+ transport
VEVEAVVWAVGYRERTDWLDLPGATDARGRLVEHLGSSPVPGLHFVGRDWQCTRGSGLLAGISRDAQVVADLVVEHLSSAPRGRAAAGAEPAGWSGGRMAEPAPGPERTRVDPARPRSTQA